MCRQSKETERGNFIKWPVASFRCQSLLNVIFVNKLYIHIYICKFDRLCFIGVLSVEFVHGPFSVHFRFCKDLFVSCSSVHNTYKQTIIKDVSSYSYHFCTEKLVVSYYVKRRSSVFNKEKNIPMIYKYTVKS